MARITGLLSFVLLVPAALAQSYKPDKIIIASYRYNGDIVRYTVWTWFALIAAIFVYRWSLIVLRNIRLMVNMQQHASPLENKQTYFSLPNPRLAFLKRHLFIAPLFSHRHNREFQLSTAVNVGTLPARLDTLLLLGYFTLNIVFCVWHVDWQADSPDVLAMLRNRTGIMAVLNMVPLFLFAGRNNPLIWLLGISFDTYNLFHRWIGRIAIVQAICHTAFYISSIIAALGPQNGWALVRDHIATHPMITTGTIAASCFTVILLQSPSVIRHAFYETFLHLHIVLALIATAMIWIHIEGLPSHPTLVAAIMFWAVERLIRFFLLIRNNWTRHRRTSAYIEAIPGEAVRVTLRIARPWNFEPGQHIYLYIPSIGLWTSHPFSIAWCDNTDLDHEPDLPDLEKSLPTSHHDITDYTTSVPATTISLVIRRRTGFTDTLYRHATTHGPTTLTAFAEGPYTSHNSPPTLHSYGTVLLFAAGVGVTHHLPTIASLLSAHAARTTATRRVVLVWVIQAPEHLEWIRPWMTRILGMAGRRDVLRVLLFVTRPRATREIRSPSDTVLMFPGRPDVRALVRRECEAQVGAMAVGVCGTGGLSDDVRCAVRECCEVRTVDLYEEAFSW